MANHKSSAKRTRSDAARSLRNRMIRSRSNTSIKKLRKLIDDPQASYEDAYNVFRLVSSYLMRAVKKGVLHTNNSSRKISKLHKSIKHKFNN